MGNFAERTKKLYWHAILGPAGVFTAGGSSKKLYEI